MSEASEGGKDASESTDVQSGSPSSRKIGKRCVAFGCGNCSTNCSMSMHALPGKMPRENERFTPLQKSWIDFINKKRKFDNKTAKGYKQIILCSGHFRHEDFDQSQMWQYQRGFRKNPPRLKPTAAPSLDRAVHPFPVDWFIPGGLADTGDIDSASATSQSSLVEDASTSTATHEIQGRRRAAADDPVLPDSAKKRRESLHIRKKEAADICAEFFRKEEEERVEREKRDFLDRCKSVQWSVKMVDRGTRYKPKKPKKPKKPSMRSMGVQARPLRAFFKHRGDQVNSIPVPATDDAAPVRCETASQTMESSFRAAPIEEDDDLDEDMDLDIKEEDDEKNDPTYKPGKDSDSDSSDEEVEAVQVPHETNVLEEDKFIVFESCLLSLFSTCQTCLSTNVTIDKVRPKCFGSQLKVVAHCKSCDTTREWYSQPKIGNLMAGNILLSQAILTGGGSPTKILRILSHMNLKVISNKTFLDHQREYLQPAISIVHHRLQQQLVRRIGEEPVILGGDGRHDSPGHCAKFMSYSLMDMKTRKVVDMQLVQSTECPNSSAMEKEGVKRSLESVRGKNIKVQSLITDRHVQVAKWMRETYPDIEHRYDVWHIAKGIKKKLTALSKQKDCDAAGRWKRSIVNHVYWCASSTPDGDGDVIAAKFRSIMNHVQNVHVDHHELFPRCQHSDEYPDKEWLREGSKVYSKMEDELMRTRLVNDVKKMSPLAQTSSVESFHSVLLHWAPKMTAYSYPGMKCRLLLAVMHWNENADRGQATTSDGTPIFKITFPKAKAGGYSVAKVVTACTFDYVKAIMNETIRLVSRKEKLRDTIPELQPKPALCAEFERPVKEVAVRQLEEHRRFAEP